MKRWLLAALLCLAPFGADAQTTKAQYSNQDGSVSPGVTVQCPDPNNAGKSYPCPGLNGTGTTTTANQGTPNAGAASDWNINVDRIGGSAAGAIAPTANSGVSSAVLKASAGNLYDIYLTNDTVKDLWLLVFNATSLPGNGATTTGTASGNLQDCVKVPAGTTGTISYDPFVPESFSVGIVAAASSTKCTTLTADTTALMIHGRAQ
jgi:hypothetical protein